MWTDGGSDVVNSEGQISFNARLKRVVKMYSK